jgi:osmotically-inducible protein OsmY
MKKLTVFIGALSLFLALTGTVMARSASTSLKRAGHDIENVAANAYQGTKSAIRDTDITAKVKLALHNDKVTKGMNIHVKTVDGIVTLWGTVTANQSAARAERLTTETTGVKGVRNELQVARG